MTGRKNSHRAVGGKFIAAFLFVAGGATALGADLAADTPMDKVSAIHDFFNLAEGKVRFQLASPETQYGWQHASRFYKTAQILRDGPISVLRSN